MAKKLAATTQPHREETHAINARNVQFDWDDAGTFTGPLHWGPPGNRRAFAPTGRRFDFTGLDVYAYRGDRVHAMRSVYDGIGVCQQLGILPPPASRAMRLVPWLLTVPAAVARVLTPHRQRASQQVITNCYDVLA